MAHMDADDDEPVDRDLTSTSTPPAAQGSSGDRATWIAAVMIIVVGLLAIGLVALTR